MADSKYTEVKSVNGDTAIEKDQFKVVDDTINIPKGWGQRHQQCLVLFWCLTVAYSMRSCMGVALVAMTASNSSLLRGNQTDAAATEAAQSVLNALMMAEPYPTFEWSKKVQDLIISSFFWGYMTLQVPSGQLAHRLGAKPLILASMGLNALISVCLPWAALYGGWAMLVALRVGQGLSQACLFPSIHTFFGKWAPLQERGRLTAFVYGGQALGTVLGLPITGFIASSSLGWPGIFRFYGILSGIMGAVWWHVGADCPASHPHISHEERTYIERGLGTVAHSKRPRVPWRRLLGARALWGVVVAHVGHTWAQLILYSEVPAFMDQVMRVNIKANGLLTALPFLVMFFANYFFSWLTDFIINKKILSVTNTRKLANTIGCWPPALCFVILAYAPKEMYIVETLLVIICALKIAGHFGFQVNHIDIAPNFAGTMMSISNFASNGVASFAPIVAGYILSADVTSEILWRKVFFVAAGFYFFTNLVYLVIGSAELAAWNQPEEDLAPWNQPEGELAAWNQLEKGKTAGNQQPGDGGDGLTKEKEAMEPMLK